MSGSEKKDLYGTNETWDFKEHAANFFKGVDPDRQNRMIVGYVDLLASSH